MGKYVIMADTTCDLPEEFQRQYDIKILPGHLVFPGKQDIPAFLKWDTISREEFYSKLKSEPASFSTAPPNIAEYAAAFEGYIKEGYDVLCLTISSAISGSYNFALAAKREVEEKHPDSVIELVDTLRFGPAIGLMAVHASVLRESGKSVKEVAEFLNGKKNCYHQAGWLDDLSFVAKKGRITHAKAFLGTLAGVKPIGEFDQSGLTTVLAKAKGAKAAYPVLLKYIRETIVDPENQIIFIAQSNRLEQAKKYKQMIEENIRPKAVFIHDVFPSCGINVGPGLMAAYYIGTPISQDLAWEKKLLNDALNGEVK